MNKLLKIDEFYDILEYTEFISNTELLNELFGDDTEIFENDIALLEGGFDAAFKEAGRQKGMSDAEIKKAKKGAVGALAVGTAITVAGIGALGYGVYRAVKGLVSLFTSLDKKIEKLKKKIKNEEDPVKKATLKAQLKVLEDKQEAAKQKIKDKKKDMADKK